MTQVHQGSRAFFEALTVKLDQSRTVIDDEEVAALAQRCQWVDHPIDIPKLNEDVYFILMDRCEGEAANRVLSALRGHGLEAYQHVYLWFAGQSGMALSMRMQRIMSPPVPKDDYALAEGLEKWLTQMTLLGNIGTEYKLSTPFKFAALRILMSNKVDKFDQLKEQTKSNIPTDAKAEDIQELNFDQFVNKLREYVTEKRLASNFNKRNADDMDIGGVGDKEE